MRISKILLFIITTTIPFCLTLPTKRTTKNSACGYESCHPIKEGYINVHIIPHTHDDVGWLKTVDQYYYGADSYIQQAGVQYILDSVLHSLRDDPDRRFIYVETAFLWKWWQEQDEEKQLQFKELIQNGQLEIIGGAWSMNDEATTHYQSIIDQFTYGLRKLNETFGECARPKIGWQIDPFGHSREMASIFAQLGFDGLFLGRIDYQDKDTRFQNKTAEMVWQASDNLGSDASIFTGVMYNTYSPPSGFCFDIYCYDEPIIDNKQSPDYNVDYRVNNFFAVVEKIASVYRSNNVIVTMGGDFNYQYANKWFINLDKLIKYGNERQAKGSKYNLIYSTPSCYLKAVYDESVKNNIKWPTKSDDFFPYASDSTAYWTGYFTSRPTIKYFERKGNNFLQICKQLYTQANLSSEYSDRLNSLSEAMGILQHHDAVSGTEKQHVADDYARQLSLGIEKCGEAASVSLSMLAGSKNQSSHSNISFQSCLLTNISQCHLTEEQKSFVVTVYNPLSRFVNFYVRLPVVEGNFEVLGPQGKSLTVDMIPIPEATLNIPGRNSTATYDLIFLAQEIPPLGFKSYYVTFSQEPNEVELRFTRKAQNQLGFDNEETTTKISYDEDTGLISSVTLNGKTIPLSQEFYFYRGTSGENMSPYDRASGAYIFRPYNSSPYVVSSKAKVNVFEGKLVTELQQKFGDWISQIIRIYATESFIEFDWIVGPIPEIDYDIISGKEIVTRYITDLNSSSIFYTDSNGRELLKRVLNYRPTWNVTLQEEISGNYYPVTSKILIRDESKNLEVAVLTDRAEGGSSLENGEIELMLHRRCMYDDGFGVEEALQEDAFGKGLVARGSHYLVAGSHKDIIGNKTLAAIERDIAQRKLLSAWTFLSSTNGLSFEDYKSQNNLEYSGLTEALPDNVQMLTLEPWIDGKILLRLEHVLGIEEDPSLSQSVTVDLSDIFTQFKIISLKESTLGANQWLENSNRFVFLTEEISGDTQGSSVKSAMKNIKDFKISLRPMQIRTFVAEIEKK